MPLNFACDYLESAHPEVLQRVIDTNFEQTDCYGLDHWGRSAADKIRAASEAPEADVFFLVGGTQMNLTVIATMLRPYEAVVAAKTGHVSCHEAGAIEHTGHKVIELPQKDGKLSAEDVEACFSAWENDGNREHMVFPKMVYLSQPTECGTLYTLDELTAISKTAHRHGGYVYVDGARLLYGLAAEGSDVTLSDLARLTDAFYIGGTKAGTLFGEAVVFPKKNTVPHFFTMVKQKGALLAKGKLLGVQFDALFTNDLYRRIGEHADKAAERIRARLIEKGYEIVWPNKTNQTFIRLENKRAEALQRDVVMSFWERTDADHTIYRLATSWATKDEDVDALLKLL